MKKLGSLLIPVLMMLFFISLSGRVFAGGMPPTTMILVGAGMLVLVAFLSKPKKGATKTAEAVKQEFLGDFALDAFADNEKLGAQFHAALDNYGKNMPKAAIAKLEKLAPLCTGEKERYAVAMASAKVYFSLQKYKDSIREYNKALVIHPTCALSSTIGDCYQRQGQLDKAREAYEFATELEPKNVDAWSRLATVYVAEGNYEEGLDQAIQALDLDPNNASCLATAAICYGIMDNALMHRHYTKLAVENGYKEEKIKETVKALKKRNS
ncbi:MAG: tetratricopeptide repeat protein [Oscillospiraceae bacterium]|nr:tetratricopeptide repeat protein [Oscillospiraceae bacterium]